LIFPLFEAMRPIFPFVVASLATITIVLCWQAAREATDLILILLGVLTGGILLVTLLSPVWWNIDRFFDHVVSIPLFAYTGYGLGTTGLSWYWFMIRRGRIGRAT
jgi:hypothetical protein